MTIELDNPVDLIMREIADPRIKQSDVALTYAFIMRQEPDADWSMINRAIARRWKGKTALARAKAWAGARYRVTEWKRNRMRDYVDAQVNKQFPLPKR